MHPKVAIIILNWNGGRDTIECLESLSKITYPNYQVIVVDNGSTDDSVKRTKGWAEEKGKPLEVIELKENLGFARGNNVGIRHASDAGYILILNNDTVVEPNFLLPMLQVFEKFPKVGLVGPKIIDYYTGKHWQGFLPWRLDFFTYLLFYTPLKSIFTKTPILRFYLIKCERPQKVYGIPGCCMLFRRKALEDVGLFDEATFLGWEEYIIAEKLLRKGYNTYVVPQSIIYHKVARDTGRIPSVEKSIIFLKSENYFQTHYLKMSVYQRWIVKVIRLIFFAVMVLFSKLYCHGFGRLTKALFERKE